MASAKINWQRLWAFRDRALNRWVNENRDPASEAVLEIRKGLQQINPDAAGDFIRLYLDDLEEKLEE